MGSPGPPRAGAARGHAPASAAASQRYLKNLPEAMIREKQSGYGLEPPEVEKLDRWEGPVDRRMRYIPALRQSRR